MNLLERYLLQISRYLPRKDRKDTIDELRSLLLDQFDSRKDEGLNDKDLIHSVIKEFGNPKDVALNYRSDEPLVSRQLEPLMYLIIKILSISLPLVILLASLIEYYQTTSSITFMSVLLQAAYTIPDILTAYITALGVVFISFVLLNKYASQATINDAIIKEKEFNPTFLPSIPKDVYKISLFEVVFNIFGSVLILYMLNFRKGLINISYNSISEPLLNTSFESILPFINISIFIGLAIHIIHLVKRRRNFTTATMEFIHGIYAVAIFIILATTSVFNTVIINGYDISFILTIYKTLMIVGAVGSGVGALAKYIKVMFAEFKS